MHLLSPIHTSLCVLDSAHLNEEQINTLLFLFGLGFSEYVENGVQVERWGGETLRTGRG